jgi:hypothetical protein
MPAEPLPCDVLPCPGGDVIIVPRGQLCIRLTPDQQQALAQQLPALQAAHAAH